MILFPAIDLYQGKAVRLFQGDYAKMTVYSEDPTVVAADFRDAGATHLHLVDLEGARFGTTSNLNTIRKIVEMSQLSTEVGGGIRNMQTVERYLDIGVDRVILGTAAVTDRAFLEQALDRFGKKVAVGVDLKDGYVAIRGWTEKSALTAEDFFAQMQALGVATVICTDVSRDGAMQGTNRELYRTLSKKFTIELIASGGVSSLKDIAALRQMGLYGAIIGKAYYTGAVALKDALEVAQ